MAVKKTKPKNQNISIMTPEFRVSYPNVFEPRLNELSDKEEYSMVMLFDKETADMAPIKSAIQKAAIALWGDDAPRICKDPDFKNPIKDGDKPGKKSGKPPHPGYWSINVKSNAYNKEGKKLSSPKIVDQALRPITSEAAGEPDAFYGGCYARSQVNVAAYEAAGNLGVTFYLSSAQKLRDGEPFGNVVDPSSIYSVVVSDSFEDDDAVDEDLFA